MLSAVLLVACLASASAKPLFFLTYAGNHGASFLNCAFPVPYYDEAQQRVTYRCPTNTPPLVPQFTVVEVEKDGKGDVEVIEETLRAPLQSGHTVGSDEVVVVPLGDALRNPQKNAYPFPATYLDCKPNQIHISELNICVDWTPQENTKPETTTKKPKKPSKPNKPSAESLIKDDETVIPSVIRPTKKCKDNEVYVAELDICVPYNNCWPHSDDCDDK